jgi:class 3 adenylate cyclase
VTSAPTGTVTFLFTDIEGSTRLWEERPDDMRAALAEHDTLLRAAIDAHGGYVFSTGGDGFAVAFSRAHDAIDAAAKAQAALVDHPLIKVRMGIHTGEVVRDRGCARSTRRNRSCAGRAAVFADQLSPSTQRNWSAYAAVRSLSVEADVRPKE